MATLVNLSAQPVEAVAVVGNTMRVLAMARPGLASTPFQPPRPSDATYVRSGEPQRSFWFVRDVATGRRIETRRGGDVRTEWVCVATDRPE
jgi:hypothetical protein